jgi:hypothetical protein
MNKTAAGLICGAIAGFIDLVPMILQNLTWDANLAAFSMWLAVGFFTAHTSIKLIPVLKGILIAFICLLPSAFIIGWTMPESLIGISAMTLVLGALVGWLVNRLTKEKIKG